MQKIIFLPVIGLLVSAAVLLQGQPDDHIAKELKYDAMMELLYRRQATDSSLSGFLPPEYKSNSAFNDYSAEDLVSTIKRRKGGRKFIGQLDVKSFSEIASAPMKANALSTCVIFQPSNRSLTKKDNGDLQLCFVPHERVPICDDPFSKEHNIADGTAFAINDSVICTTSHYSTHWQDLLFVFEYTSFKSSEACKTVPAAHVYRTKRRLYEDSERDFVLLVLDKLISRKWQIKNIDYQYSYMRFAPVYMAGYPLGVPLKVSYNAIIYETRQYSVLTDLDAFNYNSGSPVFCARTHALIGMLTGGSGARSRTVVSSNNEPCRRLFSAPEYTEEVASKFIPIHFLNTYKP
jgi:hypothetical protein